MCELCIGFDPSRPRMALFRNDPCRPRMALFRNDPCRHLASASLLLDVAAFAVCVRSVNRPFESELSMSACHLVHAWLIASRKKRRSQIFCERLMSCAGLEGFEPSQ